MSVRMSLATVIMISSLLKDSSPHFSSTTCSYDLTDHKQSTNLITKSGKGDWIDYLEGEGETKLPRYIKVFHYCR